MPNTIQVRPAAIAPHTPSVAASEKVQSNPVQAAPPSPNTVDHRARIDQNATSAGIDAAQAKARRLGLKKQWMSALYKTLLFAGALVGFGLAVAGGGIPAIVVTGLLACAMIGDACCALYNFRQQCKEQTPLPMGNDAIANAVYGLCQLAGVGEKNRIRAGSAASILTRIPLMIASAAIGYAMPSNLSSQASEVLGKLVSPIISAASKAVDVSTDMYASLKSKVEAELAVLKQPDTAMTRL